MEQSKLYKCYKPGCNKADDTENPFLTQSEYDDLLKDGVLICPETHELCGIRELKPEDYPKKKSSSNKKSFVLVGSLVGIIIIVVIIILFTGKNDPQKIQEPAPVVQPAIQLQTAPAPIVPEKVVEPVKVNPAPAEPVVKEPVKPKETATVSKAPAGTQTKNFADGSRYVGEMKDGKMHGLGTYYYKERQQISPKDLKKRFAEAGDYLIGEFYEGNVVSGKLYDAQNNVKEVVMIGR